MKAGDIILILAFCSELMVGKSFAQSAVIVGTVRDRSQTVPYATIVLKNVADKELWTNTLSDTLGYYHFRVPDNGRYLIAVSAVGYRSFTSDTVACNGSVNEYRLDILLEEETLLLQEAVIVSKKDVFETDKGKLIFHVQHSALTTGQTALDMLKKLPGVSVGQNDEILFRGSPGINVMIDGKMTYLSGNQLANFLKGMSAEDINKIELVTTPSAEFDAAGNAGIINIVPKKNLKKGYAVDLRSSVSKGRYWMTNQNISASLRSRKVNIYSSLDYNTPHSYSQNKSGNTYNDNGNTLQLSRNNDWSYKVKYYTWRMEAGWQFLPEHTVGIGYHGYFDDFKSFSSSTLNSRDASGNQKSYMLSRNKIIEPYHYDAVSMNYKFDIDTLGKKITADANYTSYRNFSDGILSNQNYTANNNILNEYVQKSHQPGFVQILSAKADADLPFKKIVLKTGVKYAEVTNDNQYHFDSLQSGSYVEIEEMSNHFKYKERIAATYFSASKKIKKTNIEAGLRMEYTNADGYTVKQGIANKWEYTKLFPSLSIGQVIDVNNKLDFSFSRRINRPSYTELNPVRWYTDKYFYWSGNPNLVPELAWVYSLTYSLKSRYVFSAAYNQSVDYIDRRLTVDDNGVTIKSQSDNFGSRRRFDLTVSAPFKPLKFWDIQLFTGINYTAYPISLLPGEKYLSLWAVTSTLQQDFSLPKDLTISLVAYFFSSELRGIYITKPTGFLNFGLKRSFFDKRFIVQLSVGDVFNTNRYKAFSQSDVTDYYYNDKPYSRITGLSVKYHLGSELIKVTRKKTEEQERL